MADSVIYLGYEIDKDGIHTNPDKVKAIAKVPIPKTGTEVKAFLGMVMYYGKFLKNISTIMYPLYALLKKGAKFEWTDECNKSFCRVKKMLLSSEVLAHYDPVLPLVLTTDASSVGVGAVIAHQMPDGSERPIAYASRVLNEAEKAYSQIDKEALAIIYGVKKFHQYLYGRNFLLKTDHKPLVSIFGPKTGIPTMAASRMQRWAVILSGYDYDIVYIKSEDNVADALSRLPYESPNRNGKEYTYLNFVCDNLPITHKDIEQKTKEDVHLRRIVTYIKSGWPGHCVDKSLQPFYSRRNELYMDAGCIMWGYRVVIPTVFRKRMLEEIHMGHMSIVKMKSIARSYMWWPGIDDDIERECKECHTCTMEAPAPPRALPQLWQYPIEPWCRLHIDYLGPIKGNNYFVLIDASTKWIEAFKMKDTTTTATIRVLREIFA